MSVTVGTLTIDLKANTASFTSEMSKASNLAARTANDVKRSLEKVAAAGLAMGAAIATGTVAVIKGALDAADEMGKLAQSAGTTAETLSTLTYAAKLSGVQTDQLGVGLVRLSKAAFAAQGGNVQLERIFGRLGVTVADSNGHLKDSGVLMEQLAVKFSKTADGAGKTALATALFGKSGAALIPFLDSYGGSQARVNAEAQRFGMVLSTSTTELADKAATNLTKLQEIFKGLGFAVLAATLPALEKLGDQLIEVARNADIPDLARAFGEKVTTAVTFLGNALEFAEKHAHALKIALEGLAGLAVLKIAIPVIGDLSAGGIANVGKGIDRLTVGLLGLERTLPVLAKFGAWAKESAQFVGLLATEEGLASAASYAWTSGIDALNAALGTTAGMLGIVAAGVAIFGVALVSEKAAAEKLAGTAVTWGELWHAAMQNVIDDGRVLLDILKFDLPKAIQDLSKFQSLRTRAAAEAKQRLVDRPEVPPPVPTPKPHTGMNTAGLGPVKKDIYGDEIRELDQAIAQQKAYLAVLDGSPEKIAAVAAAEKARAEILKLNNTLTDEGRPKLTALQAAAITQRIATEASTKALVDYGKGIVEQQRSTDLAIRQAKALAAANLEGAAAIQRVTIANAILGLNQKGKDLGLDTSNMADELAKLTEGLTRKSNIDIVTGANKEIYNLQQELVTRKMLTAATLDSVDAQRQADLAVKLYGLDQQIATTSDAAALKALEGKRQAMVDLAKAENAQADAQEALALRSPTDQYNRETDSLAHAVDALTALQDGTLTYGEQLQIAARQQDEFNKATDSTIELLLKEGSLGDGVTAFFLKMQEQAKTAAQTIFDVLNSTFSRLSDNLTALITAPNRWKRREVENQFAGTFEDAGKTLLNSTIKNQEQRGLGALGKAFNVTPGSEATKLGASRSNPMWVQFAGLAAGSGGESASAATSGINPIFDQTSKALAPFFRAPNELAPLIGSVTAASGSSSSSGGNELDDLLGAPPASRSASPQQQTAGSGAFGLIAKMLGIKSAPASTQSGVLGGETLGLPTSMSPTGALGGSQPQTGTAGVATNVMTSIGKLFGIQPKAAPAAQLPPSTVSFLSGNELTDQYGSPGAPAGSTAGANELDDLAAPSSVTGALQSIPTLLRRSSSSTGDANAYTDAVIPPSSLFPPTSTNPLSGSTNPLSPGGSGLTPGESDIPSASAAQPQPYTLITKPQPSELDKLLQAGIGLATMIAGKAVGGSGSSSSSDSDTDDGDGSDYGGFAGGGHVFGAGTGTSDSIPARLSHGEYVINAASTAKHLPMLHAINNGTLKLALGGLVGYDDGGFVSPSAAYMPASSDFSTMSASSRIASGGASRAQAGDTHTHTWNIDARGANDPAQTTAHIDRYMRTAAPQIAAMAVRAVKDQQMRRAPSAR